MSGSPRLAGVAVVAPACHRVAVSLGPDRVTNMPALVGLTVVGSALLMAGVLLSFATGLAGVAAPGFLPHPAFLGGVLIAGGLFCGVLLVVLSMPGRAQSIRRVRPAAGRRRRAAGGGAEGWFSEISPEGPVVPDRSRTESAADWLSGIRPAGPVVPPRRHGTPSEPADGAGAPAG